MKNQRSHHEKSLPGFSLIEMLVAMAITTVIMVTLLSLIGQSTLSYTQTQRAVNSLSQARAFMQFFDREISTRLPGTPLMHVTASPGGPASSDKIAFTHTLSPDAQSEDDPGDLSISAYYVDYSPDKGTTTSPKLFRRVLNPEETQALFETGASPSFPDIDPTEDEAIIYNVIRFEAQPKSRDLTTGELINWDQTTGVRPIVVELNIRFLDDSSAQRFKTQSAWDRLATSPTENEQNLIRSYSRTIAIAK